MANAASLPAAATPVAETTASGGHGAGAPAGVEGVGAAAGEYQKVVLPHCLRQPDLPGQGSDVSDLLTVTGDEGALLHLLQVRLVVDADDGDLVVSDSSRLIASPNVKRWNTVPNFPTPSIEATSRSAADTSES